MIWFNKQLNAEKLAGVGQGNMAGFMGIEFMEVGDDYLVAKMPVDERTMQPYGLLHGGASCVLAETLGSIGSSLIINPEKSICVGLEINANHVRSARTGFVTGTVRPLHIGGSTHVWDIRITDEKNQLICVSRLTVAVLPKRKDTVQ
jgi:1,4-dihydroxy-2-naphthoyl-CoA hydrolase